MIGMSWFRRVLTLVTATGMLQATACDMQHSCSLIACFDGLTISFTFGPAAIGRMSNDIEIRDVSTTADGVPIATCNYLIGANPDIQWQCSSSRGQSDLSPSIRFPGSDLRKVRVTVSSRGTQISQQTFDVTYQSAEINGAGCGKCTTAQLRVDLP